MAPGCSMAVAMVIVEALLGFGSGQRLALSGRIGITAARQDRGQLAALLGRGRVIA